MPIQESQSHSEIQYCKKGTGRGSQTWMSENIQRWCLASLMNRCSLDVTFLLFSNISSKHISKLLWTYSIAMTICLSHCDVYRAFFWFPFRVTPSYLSHLS